MKKKIFTELMMRRIAIIALIIYGATATAQTAAQTATVSKDPKQSINLYPGLSGGTVHLSSSDYESRYVRTEVYSIEGDLIQKQEIFMDRGLGHLKLNAVSGVYTFYVYGEKTEVYVLTITN